MIKELAFKTKTISKTLLAISEEKRIEALKNIAKLLIDEKEKIIAQNKKDIAQAKANQLDAALIDRLSLNEKRISQMAQGCLAIAASSQVVGLIESCEKKSNGLSIEKERIPLGVILMIFESRPNVVIDSSALAIKSGNAILLKGGKEASYSNKILGEIVHRAIKGIIPEESIVVLDSERREVINELITLKDQIDLVIPRGGESLVHWVYAHSKIPVIAHYKGLCHVYIDEEVDPLIIAPIILNAKVQRPGVCNAMETLLYHQKLSAKLLESLFLELQKNHVVLFADAKTRQDFSQIHFEKASPENFDTEYLGLFLSVKQVENIDEAILHINEHGSHHTEAILCSNPNKIEVFQKFIDASAIAINTSTRFNDGGELGLGAELGISTTKLHCYGPMGAKEMTTTRYIIRGNGQIRD